jgi:hypothetical protein
MHITIFLCDLIISNAFLSVGKALGWGHYQMAITDWKKWDKQGGGQYEKWNGLPASRWKNMLSKVTFRYSAKFLAGHCIYQMVWVKN